MDANAIYTDAVIVSIATAVLGMLGSLFIILSVTLGSRVEDRRICGWRHRGANDEGFVQGFHVVLLWLSTADLLFSTTMIMNLFNHDMTGGYNGSASAVPGVCRAQASMVSFFGVSSFLWTATLALECFRAVVKNAPFSGARHAVYHATCWGIPGVTVVVLNIIGTPSPSRTFEQVWVWCWFKDPTIQLVTFYAPLVISWMLCLVSHHVVHSSGTEKCGLCGLVQQNPCGWLLEFLRVSYSVREEGLLQELTEPRLCHGMCTTCGGVNVARHPRTTPA